MNRNWTKSISVGIDLGTTYSCVGVWANDRIQIIPNERGNSVTPSIVSFSDRERFIGEGGRDQLALNLSNTICDMKRLVGRKFSDPLVQSDIQNWPFKVICKSDDKPLIQVHHKGATKEFTPEEIASMMLWKLKDGAEGYLGCRVAAAVITVPSHFDSNQRQAMKDAGTQAGLNVQRIYNEATAAALAYGLDRGRDGLKVMVIDLGGRSCNVTLLNLDCYIFDVMATAGDLHLGGEDFDNRLLGHLVEEFKEKHNKDLATNARALYRLRSACERAKKTLTDATGAAIEIDDLMEGVGLYKTLTRELFEAINEDLFKRAIALVENILKDSGVFPDEVVLVGGSTKIPKIRQMLQECLGGKQPCTGIDPEVVVAYGAAGLAAVLGTGERSDLSEILLIDVTPLSLGVEIAGGLINSVIPRNTTIPTRVTRLFSTAFNNQSRVIIRVMEGERAVAKDNHALGELEVSGITPAPRGVPQIEVIFDLDVNGDLHISARERAEGSSSPQRLTVTMPRRNEQDFARLIREAEQNSREDQKERERIEARNELEFLVHNVRDRLRNDADLLSLSGEKEKEKEKEQHPLMKVCEELIEWLERSSIEKEELEGRKKEFESLCEGHYSADSSSIVSYGGPSDQVAIIPLDPEKVDDQWKGPVIEEVD